MLYVEKSMKMLPSALRLKEVKIHPNSVFLYHGYRLALDGEGYMSPTTELTLSLHETCQKLQWCLPIDVACPTSHLSFKASRHLGSESIDFDSDCSESHDM